MPLASDGSSATMKATLGDQAALVTAEPTVFSVAAYLGRHGWVTVALDRCAPDELAELALEAWRQRAPRGLAELHGSRARSGRRRASPVGMEAWCPVSEPCQ